eukprot:Selendium_serpulae@DN5900_c0_g3_i1.p1
MAFLLQQSHTHDFDNTCPSWEGELEPVTKLTIVWPKATRESAWHKPLNDIEKHVGMMIDNYGSDFGREDTCSIEKRNKLKTRMGHKHDYAKKQTQIHGVPNVLVNKVVKY